jgi:hypothetical protein
MLQYQDANVPVIAYDALKQKAAELMLRSTNFSHWRRILRLWGSSK